MSLRKPNKPKQAKNISTSADIRILDDRHDEQTKRNGKTMIHTKVPKKQIPDKMRHALIMIEWHYLLQL